MGIGLSTRGYVGASGVAANGVVISINNPASRFDPVSAVLSYTGQLFVMYRSVSLKFVVYDDVEAFALQWADRSSIVSLPDSKWLFTIVPNGGWWEKSFNLRFFAANEMILEAP